LCKVTSFEVTSFRFLATDQGRPGAFAFWLNI